MKEPDISQRLSCERLAVFPTPMPTKVDKKSLLSNKFDQIICIPSLSVYFDDGRSRVFKKYALKRSKGFGSPSFLKIFL